MAVVNRYSCRDEKLDHKDVLDTEETCDYFLSGFSIKRNLTVERQKSTNHFLHVGRESKYAKYT